METDINEFIAKCAVRFCPQCGKEIVVDKRHLPSGRPRKFCSDACRRSFWKSHPNAEQWGSFKGYTCPICGESFFAPHENKRTRKYCSRACANRGRAMKGEDHENSNS